MHTWSGRTNVMTVDRLRRRLKAQANILIPSLILSSHLPATYTPTRCMSQVKIQRRPTYPALSRFGINVVFGTPSRSILTSKIHVSPHICLSERRR